MRPVSVVIALTVILCFGGPVGSGRGQTGGGPGPEDEMRVALDLMDLEFPGEEGGDEMSLPPIQGPDEPAVEPGPEPDAPEPAPAEAAATDVPPVSRSAPPPASAQGLNPFLLDGPENEPEMPRSGYEPSPAPSTFADEFPADLKEVPPPPARAEGLKLPSGIDTRSPGKSDVPEIPMLKEEGDLPPPRGEDSALSMKPLPDLGGTSSSGLGTKPASSGRRPQDYLQVREDIDAQLFDLYERHYKDR